MICHQNLTQYNASIKKLKAKNESLSDELEVF